MAMHRLEVVAIASMLAEIAKKNGITVNTVRWTLRNVYVKTETNAQQGLRQLARDFSSENIKS